MSDTTVAAPLELTANHHQRMIDVLTRDLGEGILETVLQRGDLWVRVANPSWHKAVETVKRSLGCTYFVFLSGLDWLPISSAGEKTFTGEEADDDDDEATDEATDEVDEVVEDEAPAEVVSGIAGGDTRFQVFARFYDVPHNVGITLKADLDDADPRIASITDLFRGADWHEREAWEFFGFSFDGHPGLRHLYLPGEFEGHPLRKDFPLLARELKPWPGLVNVEQIPDHLDPKKIAAAAEAEAEAQAGTEVAAPGADAVPAEQAAEVGAAAEVADRSSAAAPVAQAAPEAAEAVAEAPATEAPATEAPATEASATETPAAAEGTSES